MSGIFGSKPKDYVLRPGEVDQLSQADWRRNNPNVSNAWGSNTVTFDGDQATINQQYSPELESLRQQHMGLLSQGPQQIGDLSNPFFEGAIGNAMGSVYGRTGQQMPQKPMQGAQQPQQPNPELSFGINQPSLPTVQPQGQPQPQPFAGRMQGAVSSMANSMPTSVEPQPGGGYGGGGNQGLMQLIEALKQRKKPDIDWSTR